MTALRFPAAAGAGGRAPDLRATVAGPTSRSRAGPHRLRGMTQDSPNPTAPGVDPAAAPIPTALPGDAHDAYRAAARWAGIRHRQAVHDGAGVVAAYHGGYLEGLRDAAEGRAAESHTPASDEGEPDDTGATPQGAPTGDPAPVRPTVEALEARARAEGYADGLRWQEMARRGGLVRLMVFATGKSLRRFAAEDLMRSPRRVRRMVSYDDFVEDVVRDELLRRLDELTRPR